MAGRTATDCNATQALVQLLRLAGVQATALTVRERLEDHPDFPALSALSDVLTELNVPNLATRLAPDRLADVPLPSLLQVHVGNDEQFASVRHLDAEMVEWLNTATGWQREPLDAFVVRWTGIALLIEPNEQSGERHYPQARRHELADRARVPLLLSGLALCLGLLLNATWATASGPALGLLLIKGLGTLVSGFLVAYSLDANNPALRKLCTLGKATNCQSILQSDKAKLWGDFGWADVGLIYFAGGFLVLAGGLLLQRMGALPWLLVFTLLALPYTVWSVYYQMAIARQYCTLCLMVQVLLWAEAGIGCALWPSVWPARGALLPMLGAFIGVGGLWLFIQRLLHQQRQIYPLRRQLQGIKFSETYLNSLLNNQPRQLPYLPGQRSIVMGIGKGTDTLTVVSNPGCAGCRLMHQQVSRLLEQMPDLRVEVVLVGNTHPGDRAGQVAQYLLGLPDQQASEAMDRWFGNTQQSVTKWMGNVKTIPFNEQIGKALSINNYWYGKSGLNHTPALFFNGVSLPPVYTAGDIPRLRRIWSINVSTYLNPTMDSVESL